MGSQAPTCEPWHTSLLLCLATQGQEVNPLQPPWTGESHTGHRDVSSVHVRAIFILSSLIDPLQLKDTPLHPWGMDFSIVRSFEIESSKSDEVWKGNDSPKPCLLLSYKVQARTQHDKVQVQLITLSDVVWTPVPFHSPCFQMLRGRSARAEKLRPSWGCLQPASAAWIDSRSEGNSSGSPRLVWEGGSRGGFVLYFTTVHRTAFSVKERKLQFLQTRFGFVLTCKWLTLISNAVLGKTKYSVTDGLVKIQTKRKPKYFTTGK